MPAWLWVLIGGAVALVVLVLALVIWMKLRGRRTRQLKGGFGPEYDRTLRETGDRRRAEQELQARRERVAQLQIRQLAWDGRSRFSAAWLATQSRFVDAPAAAIRDAERLVDEAMGARGYPASDFDQRTADLSVDHPRVVADYRAAHEIAMRSGRGQASTEELRQAMVHYRAVFDELLEASPAGKVEVRA